MRFFLVLFSAVWLAACTQPGTVDATEKTTVVEPRAFVEGTDYRVLEEPIAGAPDVIELFFYGCRACYHLTDELAEWSVDKGYQLNLVPAHSQDNLVESARMFHTFGVLNRLDLHVDGYVLFQEPSELQGEERINALLVERGVDPAEFWAAWSSDAVNQRLAGSYQLTLLAGISATPGFIVQGKYVVEPAVIDSSEKLTALLEHLIKLDT